MKRLGIITALSMGLAALTASAALAAVGAGIYTPDPGSFNSANAPGSSHLTSGTPQCVVAATTFDVSCSGYVLGGVGHNNANVALTANYSATIDCTNKGGNLVESHTANITATNTPPTLRAEKNGQLTVDPISVSGISALNVCPNPNWTPTIRAGTLSLNSFSYTLTFVGFASAYITISEP
jgi:hypothetical protein